MKILNLYAGIGGNRLLWKDCEVTAVDINPEVLEVYAHYNPDDTIVVGDAHQYLLDNYDKGWDFTWSSPPCQSHSRMVKATRHDVRKYPDMALYQEIIFLKEFATCPWVVENVLPYYAPLIPPQVIGRHAFWSNQILHAKEEHSPSDFITASGKVQVKKLQDWLGIHWDKSIYMGDNHCAGQVYRNAVHPRLGLSVLESIRKKNDLFGA